MSSLHLYNTERQFFKLGKSHLSAKQNIQMLARYSRWANNAILQAIADLPLEEINKKRAAAFGGIRFTLAHINIVDHIWQAHLEGRAHGFETRTADTPESFDILAKAIRKMDNWYVQYADAATEESLGEKVHFQFIGGEPGEMTRGDILLHICNHKTFHRGHLGDMFYQSGFKPPSIDLPVYLRDAFQNPELLVS